MASLKEQIAAKKRKVEQERARLQQLEAKARAADRKRDTRRKIVAGVVVLKAAETDERLRRWLMQQIEATAADRDKELFGIGQGGQDDTV